MTNNTIPKILDYFYNQAKFSNEIKRAMEEFMDISEGGVLLTFPEELVPHFTEWFIYNFKLIDGRTPLVYFYEVNPCKLSPWLRQEYKDLQENEYGLYEALKVDLDVGLEIINLSSGNKYYVYEHSATFKLIKGNLFFTRVAKNGDHFELVGADSFILPGKIGDGFRRALKEQKQELSPKDIRSLFGGDLREPLKKKANSEINNSVPKNIQEAELRLADFLFKHKLGRMITTAKIKEWLTTGESEDWGQRHATAISLIVGLVDVDAEIKTEEFNELAKLIVFLYNNLPVKEFGGLSPAEKKKENAAKNIDPDYYIDSSIIGDGKWFKHFDKGMKYFRNFKFTSALKQYNESFCELLKNRSTMPVLYRMYANKAMAHLALAQEIEAVKMLEIALELNPKYDFANYQISKYRLGKFDKSLEVALATILAAKGKLPKSISELKIIKKKMAIEALEKISLDPAIRYYEFIKFYDINFATDKPTKSKIFEAGGKIVK